MAVEVPFYVVWGVVTLLFADTGRMIAGAARFPAEP